GQPVDGSPVRPTEPALSANAPPARMPSLHSQVPPLLAESLHPTPARWSPDQIHSRQTSLFQTDSRSALSETNRPRTIPPIHPRTLGSNVGAVPPDRALLAIRLHRNLPTEKLLPDSPHTSRPLFHKS